MSFQDGFLPNEDYAGTMDASIYLDEPDQNAATEQVLETDGSPETITLLRWDVSLIPANATVLGAQITLDIDDRSLDTLSLFAVGRRWKESEVTWNSFRDHADWEEGGANGPTDRGHLPIATVIGSGTGSRSFELNTRGLSVVQAWVSDPSRNNGVLLRPPAASTDGLDVTSREFDDPIQRPRLAITYTTDSHVATNQPPVAVLSIPQSSGPAALAVRLDSRQSMDPEGYPVDVSWNIGGIVRTAAVIDTVFSQEGTVDIALTVTDELGASSTARHTVLVEAPDADSISFQQGVQPTTSYNGAADTKIKVDSVSVNFGLSSYLEVDGFPEYSTLIKWDVSQVPQDIIVLDASMTFTVNNLSNDEYEIYESLRNWSELSATWNGFDTGSAWEIPGAKGALDKGITELGIIRPSSIGRRTYALNAAGRQVVERWIGDPSSNNGFILAQGALQSDGVDFDSNENSIVANRPVLTLLYMARPELSDNQPPVVSFSVEQDMTPLSISASSASSVDSDGAIISSVWDFGNGQTATGANQSFAFDREDSYPVSVTLTDDRGGITVASRTLTLFDSSGSPFADEPPPVHRIFVDAVYPNPFAWNTTLLVTLPQADTYDLTFFDTTGRRVATDAVQVDWSGQHRIPVSFPNVAPGTYFVRIEGRATGASASAALTHLR